MGPNQERAKTMLDAIWRGIPKEFKTKYALNIWTQFENNVRSAAYTTTLALFVSRIASRMGVVIRDSDVRAFNAAVQAGADGEMLRLFRDEATLLVLLVRETNDIRREAWKAKEKAK